jgi:CheY-like chemotaxis protein
VAAPNGTTLTLAATLASLVTETSIRKTGRADTKEIGEAVGDLLAFGEADDRGGHVPARRAPRVLWVDDYPERNSTEREVLKDLGMVVTDVEDTAPALETLQGGGIDLVISDLERHGDPGAGYTLLEAVQKLMLPDNKRPPVIIYSGNDSSEHDAKVKALGGYGSTTRPDELFKLVRDALRGPRSQQAPTLQLAT